MKFGGRKHEVESLDQAVRKAAIASAAATSPANNKAPVDTGPNLDTSFSNGGVEVTCSILVGGQEPKLLSGLSVQDTGFLIHGQTGGIMVFNLDPDHMPKDPMDTLQKGVNLTRAIVNKSNGAFWINRFIGSTVNSEPQDPLAFSSVDSTPKVERPKAAMVLIADVSRVSVISGDVSTIFSKVTTSGREFLLVGKSGAKISVEVSPNDVRQYEFDGYGLHEIKKEESQGTPLDVRDTRMSGAPSGGPHRQAGQTQPHSHDFPKPVAPPKLERRLVMDRGIRVSCNVVNAQGSAILGLGSGKDGHLYPFGEDGPPVYNFAEKVRPAEAGVVSNVELHDVYVYLDSQSGKIALNIGSNVPENEKGRADGTLINVSRFYKVIKVYDGDAQILATSKEPIDHGRHVSALLINGAAKFVVQERPDTTDLTVYSYQGGNFSKTSDNANVAPKIERPVGAATAAEEKKGLLSRFKRK